MGGAGVDVVDAVAIEGSVVVATAEGTSRAPGAPPVDALTGAVVIGTAVVTVGNDVLDLEPAGRRRGHEVRRHVVVIAGVGHGDERDDDCNDDQRREHRRQDER